MFEMKEWYNRFMYVCMQSFYSICIDYSYSYTQFQESGIRRGYNVNLLLHVKLIDQRGTFTFISQCIINLTSMLHPVMSLGTWTLQCIQVLRLIYFMKTFSIFIS